MYVAFESSRFWIAEEKTYAKGYWSSTKNAQKASLPEVHLMCVTVRLPTVLNVFSQKCVFIYRYVQTHPIDSGKNLNKLWANIFIQFK